MSNRHGEPLFYKDRLFDRLQQHIVDIQSRVDSIPQDQFLISSDEILVQHLSRDFHVEPLNIYEDRMSMEQEEIEVDVSNDPDRNLFGERRPIHVPGIVVTISIPYTGAVGLWKLRPDTYRTSFPQATITGLNHDGVGSVKLVAIQPSDADPRRIKSSVDSTLDDIRFYIAQQKPQINQHNQSIDGRIRAAIQARRLRLQKHAGIVSALKIPLRPREGVPPIQPIPIARKLVRPLPTVPKGGFKAEPGIQDADYEHILAVIRHEGRTFEATPKTYAVHDEEELRDIMLAHLNGHYAGGATGETFRRKGKTDIRIEDADRAAFVGECKVWRGAKEISEACDQLLGYLTWRDSKAALLIFNKHNARFSEILDRSPATLTNHRLFLKSLSGAPAGEWRFMFRSDEDDARVVTVHVFAFNLYAGTPESSPKAEQQ